MRRNLLLAFACALAIAAAAQPTWRFHLAFEDGTGARDTIWLVYDTLATASLPIADYALGEGPVDLAPGEFHVFLINQIGDTTQTNAFPYYWFPIFNEFGINANNWAPPHDH